MTTAALSIGDFSRATLMSVKMLRHYHQIGLLQPAAINPDTGYRSYTADQIPTAQIIRRFRELQMPLERIRDVLAAPDPATRNTLIASHLDALQISLAQTQSAVALA
jgi:DNA-binding transcriptional MerR regulator